MEHTQEFAVCKRWADKAPNRCIIDLGPDATGVRYGLRDAHLVMEGETVAYRNQHGLRMAAVDMAPKGRSWETCNQTYPIPDYEQANARLIAAAPDMLAALQAIDAEGTDINKNGDIVVPSHIWDMVSQAIIKATGA